MEFITSLRDHDDKSLSAIIRSVIETVRQMAANLSEPDSEWPYWLLVKREDVEQAIAFLGTNLLTEEQRERLRNALIACCNEGAADDLIALEAALARLGA